MYKIILSNGWKTQDKYTGLTEREAIEICKDNDWRYVDVLGFEWSMSYVDED